MNSVPGKLSLNKDTVILLFSTLIIALCGFLYELLIGTTASYLLGNSVKQFSFTIGAFMTSFGIGSYFSKYVRKKIIFTFFIVETMIGFLGSISIISLFYFYSVSDLFPIVMYFFIISIGALVGLEIPLIGRIIDGIKKDIRLTLANLLSFDYLGAMIGSLLLPLVLLPYLGLIQSSILVGIGNLFISILIGYRFKNEFSKKYLLIPFFLLVIDCMLFVNAKSIQTYIEQKFYDDKIIFHKRSKYQKIVLTQDGGDIRLFLDGNIQFSSVDEYRYHEPLVHLPLSLLLKKNSLKILILGGGDGLAVREILKYPGIKKITVCDLDPVITQLAKQNPFFVQLNKNSMMNPLVEINNQDAFLFLQSNIKKQKKKSLYKNWDLIIIDLPDPNNESLAKLYSKKFYILIRQSLTAGGIAITQAVSPFHAKKVFWCIYNTIKSAGFESALPLNVNIPSFGVWGFIMFSRVKLTIPQNLRLNGNQNKFLDKKIIPKLFIFPKDTRFTRTRINKIFQPVILSYYEDSWRNY